MLGVLIIPYDFLLWLYDPTRVMASSLLRFLDHTQQRTTVGRTPLDEWSARRRDLYLTTHNTHNRQTSMPPDGIRTRDLNRGAAADLRLRPRDHWDRLSIMIRVCKLWFFLVYDAVCFLRWDLMILRHRLHPSSYPDDTNLDFHRRENLTPYVKTANTDLLTQRVLHYAVRTARFPCLFRHDMSSIWTVHRLWWVCPHCYTDTVLGVLL